MVEHSRIWIRELLFNLCSISAEDVPKGSAIPAAQRCDRLSAILRGFWAHSGPIVSDVPGPNSYNVDPGPFAQASAVVHHTEYPITDSQLDSYKHGAFLEKADRFTEAKPSDVPGEPQYHCRPPHLIFPDTLL